MKSLEALLEVRPTDKENATRETQIGALVLTNMLQDYQPELKEQMHMPEAIKQQMKSQVASIEVVWTVHDGPCAGTEVVRRFFAVPEMSQRLSAPLRDGLVENVDRSNTESKLLDFIARTADVYVELNMVDGGSGKCVRTLAPEGVSERGQRALKSISCELGKP